MAQGKNLGVGEVWWGHGEWWLLASKKLLDHHLRKRKQCTVNTVYIGDGVLSTSSKTSGKVLQDWQTRVVVPLFKKVDRRVCSNYRGITLLNLPGKVCSGLLERRVRRIVEPWIQEEQCGFCPGRGTVDQLSTLSRVLEVNNCSSCRLRGTCCRNVCLYISVLSVINSPICLPGFSSACYDCSVRLRLMHLFGFCVNPAGTRPTLVLKWRDPLPGQCRN